MPKWLLPTVSEVLALSDPTWSVQDSTIDNAQQSKATGRTASRRVRAEREWRGAIAALIRMLQQKVLLDNGQHPKVITQSAMPQGLILSGPLPILSHPELRENLSTWTFTASALELPSWFPFKLLPADRTPAFPQDSTTPVLPLLPGDPLAAEQFCLALTPWFSLVMVLGETLTGEPAFMFSLMPEVVERVWEALRPRVLLMRSGQIEQLDHLIDQFPPVVPNYQTVMQFSRLMLENLPDWLEEPESGASERTAEKKGRKQKTRRESATHARPIAHTPMPDDEAPDLELLQAIAHEVRTPLTTIRTLTRLLLRRQDLPPDVLKRLEIIDRECNEQIDRFGLIFRAVELETASAQPAAMALTRTSLAQVFQQSIPRWQQQASQRNLTLDVLLPKKMPAVVSDPSMLDKALTSLIERFTRSLSAGSHIQMEVMLAGNQLKLQLQSQPDASDAEHHACGKNGKKQSPLKSIGQLLMFQPETGSLSLNLAVTKNLFQALGGKLIVRERPQQGEVMTVYLPLEMNSFPIDIGDSEVLEV